MPSIAISSFPPNPPPTGVEMMRIFSRGRSSTFVSCSRVSNGACCGVRTMTVPSSSTFASAANGSRYA